ncbi:MAG: hypothetical protein A3A27_00295 [Candidatus Wildermuthbacteria bacterium RIFCSPLOWO2_01_FULL_47_18]|uniref:DUF3105 domain-containing protein n=2 Tax=Candidatus Wildermuthiibacteriota TaxID=1817923 RepID=A0A1G2RJY0_9BACT|nr:MAG: hypothetical protein A3J68_01625 [Candidatus Wildermuthbacteria bacterium RIFCSPHIGHO2_02_FULL_48_16]OHA72828.1 MAG: hypothetical protein A3A27_00295 [Candidatus Wildermuthbacteria bacterium RIFCSPLOWO2_01_FULL_47_18]
MEQLSPKEQYDLSKAQKGAEKQTFKAPKNLKWILVLLLLLLFAIGAVFFLNSRREAPGADLSRQMNDEGDAHVTEGTDVAYQSNPPTSGNHWPVPLTDGVYKTEKRDQAVVHSLEHGRVWISYKPSLPANIIEQLEKLGDGQALIVTPRNANETDIALAAWTRLDTFNLENGTLDEKRVQDFIRRYKNKGPEFIPGSGGGKTYE